MEELVKIVKHETLRTLLWTVIAVLVTGAVGWFFLI